MKPVVHYMELSEPQGHNIFQVVASQSLDWSIGEQFSDEDMDMAETLFDFVCQD